MQLEQEIVNVVQIQPEALILYNLQKNNHTSIWPTGYRLPYATVVNRIAYKNNMKKSNNSRSNKSIFHRYVSICQYQSVAGNWFSDTGSA